MNDLDIAGSRGTLMRSVRTGAALFGSGLVIGIVLGMVFHTLLYMAVVIAAVVIVVVAIGRLAIGRRRRY